MYDVLIAGAGPAGAGVAALLAGQGARVLLLEKERFPRYKVCAGAVDGSAARALAAMGIDPAAVEEAAPTELCVTSDGRYPAWYQFERPLAKMTMRADLDALIADVAVARGAEFHDGEGVKVARDNGHGITVQTGRGCYEARVLVGADGVYSVVARDFGLNRNPIRYVATEAEIEVDGAAQASWAGRVQIDISVWPPGYSWIFPKRDHLSAGTGVPLRYARDLKQRFARFQQRAQLGGGRTLEQHAHMIGFRRGQEAIAAERVLLVGDAAGLVDPNTGGGIGPALQSAHLAAATLLPYLKGETGSLRSYTVRVDEELGSELRAARILHNMILLRLLITGGRATRHRELWHEVARVIRGEERYGEWYAHSRLARWLAWTKAIPL